MKAVEEQEAQERLQRQREYLRQKEAREQMLRLRHQQEEEERQREAYEAARRQRAQQQRKYWRPNNSYGDAESSDSDEEPEFHIVRGYDGRLYQIKNPAYQKRRQHEVDQTEVVRGRDGRLYRVKKQKQTYQPSQPSQPTTSSSVESDDSTSRDIPITKTSATVDIDPEGERIAMETKSKIYRNKRDKKSKRKKKRITVIVEDASDSEYEDEMNSPWRNRRPDPGEWLQPVENFQP